MAKDEWELVNQQVDLLVHGWTTLMRQAAALNGGKLDPVTMPATLALLVSGYINVIESDDREKSLAQLVDLIRREMKRDQTKQ